eukprot:scaffold27662_cov154-Skeletonema_menzelii.AAC.2
MGYKRAAPRSSWQTSATAQRVRGQKDRSPLAQARSLHHFVLVKIKATTKIYMSMSTMNLMCHSVFFST